MQGFQKSNCSKEVFVVKTAQQAYVIKELNNGRITGTFSKEKLQKTERSECRNQTEIKDKGSEMVGKWKGYDN